MATDLRTALARSVAVTWGVLLLLIAGAAQARTLEELVQCRVELVDLDWSHMIWPEANPAPKPARATVLSDERIRTQVEEQLRMNSALASLMAREIDSATLQAELDRIGASTRASDRLREMFAALDNDPDRIGDCLARPLLVERLLRAAVAGSVEFSTLRGDKHADPASANFDAWWKSHRHTHAIKLPPPSRGLELPRIADKLAMPESIAPDTWYLPPFPLARGAHSAVWTGTEMIIWGGFAGDHLDSGARYTLRQPGRGYVHRRTL